jgi:hypothetical protein
MITINVWECKRTIFLLGVIMPFKEDEQHSIFELFMKENMKEVGL